MPTPTLFSLFDEVTVFRPQAGLHVGLGSATIYTAPADGRVQIRYDVRALRVWLFTAQDDVVAALTIRNPRIVELSEDQVTVEGFEQHDGALTVETAEVTVVLSAARLRE